MWGRAGTEPLQVECESSGQTHGPDVEARDFANLTWKPYAT